MASPVVVNGDTSLVLIDTSGLTANQSAVVILSTINYPGRTVTIRDSLGYLSSPQTIIVSTQQGVLFADGTSSIVMTQPYAFLTVASRDSTSWNLKNSFAFPQNQTIANAAALTTSSVVTSNVYAYNFVSTPYLNTQNFNAISSYVTGPSYTSSLLVGPPYTTMITDPGYSLYVQGNFKNLGTFDVEGSTNLRGTVSTGSNLNVIGNISTLGSFGARGDIMTLGNIFASNGILVTNSLTVASGTNIGGSATFGNSLTVASNVTLQGAVTGNFFTTSSLQVTSSINLQEKYIAYRSYDLLFSDPITVPGISTQNITASNAITTSNLTVYNSIDARQVSSFLLSSAVITNPGGTLSLSSITANTVNIANTVSTNVIQTSSIAGSTLYLTGNINASGTGYLNVGNLIASTISTNVLSVETIYANIFNTENLAVNSLLVASDLIADNVSSFSASNVFINNAGGSISTGSLSTGSLLTSTFTNVSGRYLTAGGPLRFVAPNVSMESLTVSSIAGNTVATSTITASRLTLGTAPSANNAPRFTSENTYPSTNVLITGGPGDFLTPFFLSNVTPPGTLPGTPYAVDASFRLNFVGPQIPGYFANILGLTLFPNGEASSQITIRTYNDSNAVVSLYGLYGSNQSYSTPPNTGGIPVPGGAMPSSFIHVTGTMYGASAFSLQFLSRSNDNYSAIDSNMSITVNNGSLRWPYYLNGTTIQNSLNDMSVRSLYYYGSLNFASDPSLKEDIHDADLEKCYHAVEQIPLQRFKYIDAYMSTFQQKDTYRLGFIATDLEKVFPKSITYTQLTDIPGYESTFRMIDTQQIEMAHIGATKVLMAKVSTLRNEISDLKNLLER
jgi:hypothetical protein